MENQPTQEPDLKKVNKPDVLGDILKQDWGEDDD